MIIFTYLQFGSRGPSPPVETLPQGSGSSVVGSGQGQGEEDEGISEERRLSAVARRVLQRVEEEGEGANPLEAWKQRAEEVVGLIL